MPIARRGTAGGDAPGRLKGTLDRFDRAVGVAWWLIHPAPLTRTRPGSDTGAGVREEPRVAGPAGLSKAAGQDLATLKGPRAGSRRRHHQGGNPGPRPET